MKAETLNCPNCGAAISSDSPRCQFCESKLATVACPSCFAMMFIGSRHCPHCGAAAADTKASSLSTLTCPKCKSDMLAIRSAAQRCANAEAVAACGSRSLPQRSAPLEIITRPCSVHRRDRTLASIQLRQDHSPLLSLPQCAQLMNRRTSRDAPV